jgi:membrane protease YdiL (CAAX protease family)
LCASIGVSRPAPTRGLGLTLLFGAALQLVQLLNSRQREEVFAALAAPWGFLLPFAAFALLLATAATTEEVFFRGVLQTRLAEYFESNLAGLAVATAAFVFYHVPYAYLKPSWPSYGHFGEAFQLAAANGLIGGLALGFVYWRSERNLLASICLHALINLMPAIRLLARLG